MKYTIEGFSQEYALSLRKRFEKDGKTVTRKIDCVDLVILRWFVDFYPNTKKVEVNGKQYAWITHGKLVNDLPLLDLTKRGFSDRLQKLVDFEILTHALVKEGGTFSLYGFGDNYSHLIGTGGGVVQTAPPVVQTAPGVVQATSGCCSNRTPGAVQTHNIDISIKDISIKYSSSLINFIIEKWNLLEEFGVEKISNDEKTIQTLSELMNRYKPYLLCDAIRNISESDFLTGKATGFKITFKWFSKPENFEKVLSGKYN